MQPRGYRNNNPLNIRRNPANVWQGEVKRPKQYDPLFVQFRYLRDGYRAGFVLIRNYAILYKIRTLSAIINRFAPNNENDTDAYIARVSSLTGIQPNQLVGYADQNTMCRLVYAMATVENGVPPSSTVPILEAWHLYEQILNPIEKRKEVYR